MRLNYFKLNLRFGELISRAILAILLLVLAFPQISQASGSLTTVKDTLTNDRPSVATTISSAITAGDTTINAGSTAGFNQGDSIVLCAATCATTETRVVSGIISAGQLALTVGTTNSYGSGSIYLKSTSKHTITFTTRSAVSAGKFVVTLPGASTPNGSIPSSGGFAFNNIAISDITLSGGTAGTITTSSPSSNVVITVPFTGSIASSTAITITIGNSGMLLNPTKTAAQGTADTFSVQVDEQDGSSNVVDSTTVKVGTIEAVGVSVTVAPSLTFTINAVTSGTSVTAHATNITTTATSVPFGTITVNASTTAAQYLHIDTNSNSGYTITAQQDGSLRKSNGTAIVDFSSAAAAEQDGNVGFGYSLQSKAGSPTMAFNYNDSSRKFNAIGFSSTTPATVISNSGPANGDEAYVDYYLKINAQQAQGDYRNLITYIATAIY